jgi:bacillithiol synthase
MPVASESARKVTILPLDQTGPTALFKAFVGHDPAVRQWYPHDPFAQAFPDPSAQYPAERRAAVAAILADQNLGWGAGEITLANIERFRAGAAAIVTGQQVGLFGGPLYSILKALTAIKLAEQETRKGKETVAIFWLATEDHDLDEVSFAQVLDREHQLRKLKLPIKSDERRVGDVELPSTIPGLTAQLREIFGESEVLSLLARCYASGTTFGDAYARFFAALFQPFGLILIDNRDARLHQIGGPIFSQAAAQSLELNAALQKRSRELVSAGFHAQVHVEDSSTLLFHHQNGKRIGIKIDSGRLKAGKREWSCADLAKQMEAAPGDFSANALLRPIVQDYLLPTTAYVGGAAEVAYFAQSEVIYHALLGRVTPVLPRAGATMIEPAVARLLDKYQLDPQDVFTRAEEVRLKISQTHLPRDVQNNFSEASATVESKLNALEDSIGAVDPTLRGAADNAGKKIRYQLRRLAERAARAQLRRQSDMDRQLRRISNSLYPNNNLQERELSGIYFLAQQGTPLLHRLVNMLRTDTADHQFIWL